MMKNKGDRDLTQRKRSQMDPTKLQERRQRREAAQRRAMAKGTMSMRAFFSSNSSTIGGGILPASVAAPVDAGQ
jgi:hypothetical protein